MTEMSVRFFPEQFADGFFAGGGSVEGSVVRVSVLPCRLKRRTWSVPVRDSSQDISTWWVMVLAVVSTVKVPA